MGADNLAAVEAAMREVYDGGVEDLTGNASPTIKKVEDGKDAIELNSRGAALVIRPDNNNSELYSQAEFVDFPDAGSSPLVKMTVPFTGMFASCKFPQQVFAENKQSAAIVDVVTGAIDNKMDAIQRSKNQMLWGDSSAERGRVSAVNLGTGVVTHNNAGNLYGTYMLEKGMQVEFRDNAGTLRQGGGNRYATITAKNDGALTTSYVIGSLPTDIANNDRVYIKGSFNSAPRGFLYHLQNSGAWQGIADRTVYRLTSPAIQSPGGSPVLSASLMDKLASGQAFKRGKRDLGKVKWYVSSQYDAFLNIGYEMKIQDSTKLDPGFTEIAHAGIGFEWDPHIQRDGVFLMDVSYLKVYRMQKMDFVRNEGGGYFHQLNASQGQMKASGKSVHWEGYENYGTKNVVALGTRIAGLSTAGLDLGNNT
jgi:hypothetical protein